MTDLLLNAHSGWRYVVLLVLIVTFLYYLFEYIQQTKLPYDRQVDLAFGTSIHIQIGLGILLLIAFILDNRFEGRLMGHVVLMLILLPITIMYSKYAKALAVVSPRRRRQLGMATPIICLILIYVGLLAISRGLFG